MPWLCLGLREGFRAKVAMTLHVSSNRSILTAPVGQVGRGSAAWTGDAKKEPEGVRIYPSYKSVGRFYGSRRTRIVRLRWPFCASGSLGFVRVFLALCRAKNEDYRAGEAT